MIALDDQALARLAIGATAVPREKRARWLADLAARLERPERSPAAVRQRRARARQRNGRGVFRIEVDHDRVVLALIESGRLSEGEALRRDLVERELGHVLEEWNRRWTEAR